ncbi:hypothetical protein PsorP6_009800 [Peronosclerospora sorghi]|uniref:Uncharacterized protein n=1 Tax=Peronosclerospora sorghi TaxID=230839 RepID=A0ACC0VYT6_9STRA|nr:hypothetical protein PsorP6_009800 [Peronosclerospora sorghi]
MEEQDTHSKEMHKTKQELCDMQKKLGETIASLTEEKNVSNAKIKAEHDEERFNVKQASQETESKLQKHVALLISAELEKSKAEVDKLTSELNVADAKVSSAGKRILTLGQE